MSVPQIVVVVIRIKASSGPTSRTGLSSRRVRLGSTNTAAFIICAMVCFTHRRTILPAASRLDTQFDTYRPHTAVPPDALTHAQRIQQHLSAETPSGKKEV